MSKQFDYDEVPYPSFTFPQTRPDRLSTLGLYFGIETALPNECRVLELGCGNGTNLLSFAYCLPNSRFVGFDLAKGHIDEANATKKRLGIGNAAFECADITTLSTKELGKFDFIIAHGLFSWVPDLVRESILKIYSECLEPNGVGYISYNAFPGFYLREITRGMMRYHTASLDDPNEKVKQAVAMLSFIARSIPTEELSSQIIQRELKDLLERTTSNVYHDDLSELNQAFYFHEFASMIADHGLKYLSESDITSSSLRKLPEESRAVLADLGSDTVRLEQYLDFISMRRFRSSLICHADVSITRNPPPETVEKFRIATQLKPADQDADINGDRAQLFQGYRDQSATINHPLTKAALVEMSAVWPRSIEYRDLLERAGKRSGSGAEKDPDEQKRLNSFLLELFGVDFVKFSRFQPLMTNSVSEKPRVSEFARWQVEQNCNAVTTMAGLNIEPDSDLVKAVILMADGTRSVQEICKEVAKVIEIASENKEEFQKDLPKLVDNCLDGMVAIGLLIG